MQQTCTQPRLTIVTTPKWDELKRQISKFDPKSELGKIIKSCFGYLPPDLAGELLEAITRTLVLESSLGINVFRLPDSPSRRGGPLIERHGIVSRKLVTNNGVAFLVDACQNSVEMENMKYHGLGTNNTAENAADSGLNTELTTQYNPDSTRATGTTEEGATANIFKTIATNTLDEAATIEEHGVFSAASGGVLLDRSLTGTQTLSGGDGLMSTYQLTCSAGG